MKSPQKISGLKLWLDAADPSTINNGTVTQGQNVFKIVDKASGFVFRNGYGVDGPSYSVGVVNGQNAITFNYYTLPNSVQAKGLWAGNVTPMATGTYSLYCVSFPYDNRQRNTNGALPVGAASSQNLWLFSLINSLPIGIPLGYQPNRALFFRSPGGTIGATNSNPLFQEDTDFQTTPVTTLFDKVNSLTPGNNSLPQSDSRYIYGKTNVIGVRASDGAKKLTIIRTGYISNENFQTNSVSTRSITPPQGFTPASGGPWLTIGAIAPNPTNRSVEGVFGPMPLVPPTNSDIAITSTLSPIPNNVYPFEGHFCEFLFWDRVLSDSESSIVEKYLIKKWIN